MSLPQGIIGGFYKSTSESLVTVTMANSEGKREGYEICLESSTFFQSPETDFSLKIFFKKCVETPRQMSSIRVRWVQNLASWPQAKLHSSF